MMEVGEIIRKMSSSGKPIGSLAIVEKIEGEIIIAKYITPPTTDKLRINIDHVYSCVVRTVQIDDSVLFNIMENDLGTYTLEVEPSMSRILTQGICDLLCLEGKISKRKIYFDRCHFQALSLPQYVHCYFGSMVYKGR